MKNPLLKRIPREIKSDLGKYLGLFLFMAVMISFISGFLVADISLQDAYFGGLTKYNIEDGHIAFSSAPEKEILDAIEEKSGIKLYDLEYFEEELDGTAKNFRVYKDREEVNLECVMDGRMPEADDEIVIDRMFGENNDIKAGDEIKLAGRTLKVTGYVALPDYSCLFEKSTDMMFDSINFTIAVMTKEGYDRFASTHIHYNYAWQYPDGIDGGNDEVADKESEKLVDVLTDVLKENGRKTAEKIVAKAKLSVLAKAFDVLFDPSKDLSFTPSMFDNEEGYKSLLEMVEKGLSEQGVDLEKEFSDVTKEFPGIDTKLSTEDVKAALKLSDEEKDSLEDEITALKDSALTLSDYLPRYVNQAINFTGDDMGGDKAFIILFDYIITVVLAFVFAVTISNTITQEAGTIGTLRASGYTRGELIRHYMILPVAVTFLAACIGNILGYTVLKNVMAGMYYRSYSLCTFETKWSAEAFVITTVVPVILMFVINLTVLMLKLRLSPLRFIRHDLSRKGKKKAFKLKTTIPILRRFRLRILFQNIPNYITLFLGIFLASVICIFGLMFMPLLDDYADMIIDERISDYQYILSEKADTNVKSAERFSLETLKTTDETFMIEEVSIYGVVKDSKYVKTDIEKGTVVLSSAMATKYGLGKGDTIALKEKYGNKIYDLKVSGDYTYSAGMAVFMDIDDMNAMFGKAEGDYTGYFSNEPINDIDSDKIAFTITVKDLTKTSDQLSTSFGGVMQIFQYFGIVMFLILMYMLSRQIIEKNAVSISMVKILGFKNKEIGGLYIVTTSLVVLFSLLISIPITHGVLYIVFSKYLYTRLTGYVPFIISPSCYIYTVILGIVAYVAVAALQLLKIRKIPMSEALKNVE